MKNTKIEWTHTRYPDGEVVPGHTFNPWWGCTKISPACKNCYAATTDAWRGGNHWAPGSARKEMSEKHWKKPLQWNREASASGRRPKVFCGSMCDVLEDHPGVVAYRERLWETIDACRDMDWLLCTKRAEHYLQMTPPGWHHRFPDHVWPGGTLENQDQVDKQMPHLERVNARVRFVSCEPLLGPLDLVKWLSLRPRLYVDELRGGDPNKPVATRLEHSIDWVIAGGESGLAARPSHPDWFHDLQEQCTQRRVPFFFKQWGRYSPAEPGDMGGATSPNDWCMVPYWPKSTEADGAVYMVRRSGKEAAGRLLAGRLWDQMPGDPEFPLRTLPVLQTL